MNEIPRTIYLGGYTYTYKDELINGFLSFRCKYRTSCKVTIKIDRNNINKINNKENLDNIEYFITSTEREHKCLKNNNIKKIDKSKEEVNAIKKQKDLAFALIEKNIQKPYSFHVNNFKKNNLNFTGNQIKYLLQKIREETYPSNIKFLNDISKITISFGDEVEVKDLPMCYKYVNMIDIKNKNKLEKYIIFTSKFQINLLNKCEQLFFDGTFKTCPKTFYQIINVAGYLPEINALIPIFMVPTTSKTEYIYNQIFNDIKNIIRENNLPPKSIPNKVMVDFEKSLINAIKKNFPDCIINPLSLHEEGHQKYISILYCKSL